VKAHLFVLAAVIVALLGCSRTVGVTKFPIQFPPNFLFGFATVAYQSEGTLRRDDTRVQSNWSEWEDLGKVQDGQRNDLGNGFRDGYAEDLDRAAALGANTFSYAVDWARLEPEQGVFDEKELKRIVDIITAMRVRGLKPLIVLFHWVTPAWVQSPKTGKDMLAQEDSEFVDSFMEVVNYVVPPLAGLVDDWVTFEEPYSIVLAEYIVGEHPPGKILDIQSSTNAIRNLMHLHARTFHMVKNLDNKDTDGDGIAATVGLENLAVEVVPLHPDASEDIKVARHFNYILNHQFVNAIWNGDVDLDLDGQAEENDPDLARTLDFIGLNYYQRVRAAPGALRNVAPFFGTPYVDVREYDPSLPHSDMYQEVSPQGLRTVIEEYSEYGLPLYITENGMADDDDDLRPSFLLDHIYTVGMALADGYDIRGFYVWTISDNFEWADGRGSRFGLYKVDYTREGFPRTKTRSANLFSAIAECRCIDSEIWNAWASR